MKSNEKDIKNTAIDLKSKIQRMVDSVDKLEQRVSDLEFIRGINAKSKKQK